MKGLRMLTSLTQDFPANVHEMLINQNDSKPENKLIMILENPVPTQEDFTRNSYWQFNKRLSIWLLQSQKLNNHLQTQLESSSNFQSLSTGDAAKKSFEPTPPALCSFVW